MNCNKSLFFLIIVLYIFSIIFLYGCSEDEQDTISSVNESSSTVIEETTTITEETDATGPETTEEAKETSTAVSSNGETETTVDPDVITFKTNKVNENTATMILEINLETKEVSGVIQMGFKGFDMDMSSTKICDYVLTGAISGELDAENLKIKGRLEGNARTDTVSQDCDDYIVSYEMFADISEDFTKIKGYFDTRTMDDYEFFLKQVTD